MALTKEEIDERAAEAATATLKKAVGAQWDSDVEKAKKESPPAEKPAALKKPKKPAET